VRRDNVMESSQCIYQIPFFTKGKISKRQPEGNTYGERSAKAGISPIGVLFKI